ncbi:MAG TPA: hypothetical protein PKD86_12425 [Gemmatales bacterium]|nr:hypothetical protein [Gemmatales bacterium]HMP60148.1 hypothetical protein [Gemmatales bacterium]
MKAAFVLALFGALALPLNGPRPLLAQDKPPPSSEESKPVSAVKDLVANFYQNWKQGKAVLNHELFLNADVTVVGISPDHRPSRSTVVWQKKAGELLKEWEAKPPKHLRLDAVEVDVLGTLAVARVTHMGSGIKVRGVFTLYAEAETWRIVALVLETRFNW